MYPNILTLKSKVVWPLVIYASIFAVTTILVTIQVEGNVLFGVTLLSTLLCGLCGATLSAGLFGLGALLPPSYTGNLMTGQALAGLLVSLSSLLTTLASHDDTCVIVDDVVEYYGGKTECKHKISYSALFYFIIATFVLISCIQCFLVMFRLKFTQYYILRAEESKTKNGKIDNLNDPLLLDEEISSLHLSTSKDHIINAMHNSELNGRKKIDSLNTLLVNDISISRMGEDSETFSETLWRVFKMIKIPAFSVFYVFVVSISIFPSLFVRVLSERQCTGQGRFYNDLFVPFLFVLFNLMDFTGRIVANNFKCYFSAQNIWIPSVMRTAFIPLMLLCNLSSSQLEVVFPSDFFPIFFMILFGFSNGYCASYSMMYGPSIVSTSDQSLAGTIMIFSLTMGLFFGASFSFLITYVSTGTF